MRLVHSELEELRLGESWAFKRSAGPSSRFRRKQPALFNALNDIEVPWNPLRHFRDAD